MKKIFEEDSNEFNFFMDYYNLVQKYVEPEKEDLFWENLMNDFCELHNKYNTIYFSKQLCQAYIISLVQKYKG